MNEEEPLKTQILNFQKLKILNTVFNESIHWLAIPNMLLLFGLWIIIGLLGMIRFYDKVSIFYYLLFIMLSHWYTFFAFAFLVNSAMIHHHSSLYFVKLTQNTIKNKILRRCARS